MAARMRFSRRSNRRARCRLVMVLPEAPEGSRHRLHNAPHEGGELVIFFNSEAVLQRTGCTGLARIAQ